jgi:hypothetical protein
MLSPCVRLPSPERSCCSEHAYRVLDPTDPEDVDAILSAYTADPPRVVEQEDGSVELHGHRHAPTPWDAAMFAPPWRDLEGLDGETLRPVFSHDEGDGYGPPNYLEAHRRYEQSREGGGLWDEGTAAVCALRYEDERRRLWAERMRRRRVRVQGTRPVQVRAVSGAGGRIRVR